MSARRCYLASIVPPSHILGIILVFIFRRRPLTLLSCNRFVVKHNQHVPFKSHDLTIRLFVATIFLRLFSYLQTIYVYLPAWIKCASLHSFDRLRTGETANFTRTRVRCPVFELVPPLRFPSPQQISTSTARCPAGLKARSVNQCDGGVQNIRHLRGNVRTLSTLLAAAPEAIHSSLRAAGPGTIGTSPITCWRHLIGSRAPWSPVLPPLQDVK